jgi:multisubunit Na+/H+ antiporter MnhC subunit
MELLMALVCGALVASGVWSMLGRDRGTTVAGGLLLAAAVSLALVSVGGMRAKTPPEVAPVSPALSTPSDMADPTPHALALVLLLPAVAGLCVFAATRRGAPGAPPEPPRITRPPTPPGPTALPPAPRAARPASGGVLR